MRSQDEEQFFLLIGLGGTGSRIAADVFKRINGSVHAGVLCIDTDYRGLDSIKIPEENKIYLMPQSGCCVEDVLREVPGAENWFPDNVILKHSDLRNGIFAARVISRLLFERSLAGVAGKNLFCKISSIVDSGVAKKYRGNVMVSVITSLCGGTGSGIFIQVALMIRKYLSKHFPGVRVEIAGSFIFPSYFKFLTNDESAGRLEANTYAAMKELNAINDAYLSDNGPAVHLKHDLTNQTADESVDIMPFDQIFIYDKPAVDDASLPNAADAIAVRLLAESPQFLHGYYGFLHEYYKIKPVEAPPYIAYHNLTVSFDSLPDLVSYIKHSKTGSFLTVDAMQVVYVKLPVSDGSLSAAESPDDILQELQYDTPPTFCIEFYKDSAATKITAVEFNIKSDMNSIDELKYGSGNYYKSYIKLVNRKRANDTPHLDKRWSGLPDIGAPKPEAKDRQLRTEETDPESKKPEEKPAEIAPAHTARKVPAEPFVFISYSSKEYNAANHTRQVLESNGIPCWMAPQSIPAGGDYATEIPNAIQKCKVFLLLLSKASQESRWVPKEVGIAITDGKAVIPFHIDDSDITGSFNFFLTNTQRISAYNRLIEAYKELVDRLKELFNS